ncbi:transglutaminase [Rhodopirellula islandica]|uniref:Transglutaminase n=1 Tax=Rhodopirellula islandica TaxID=595434 RepID=A0A0J1BIM5_RHOIS|nr:transglutaminase family protein [Rhodopirellula islandica]KLU06381.1 transglutaminase [Rhodopirellula islandica]
MIFQVSHRIHFRYDQPVVIQPLTIRLRPRSDGAQRVLYWNCQLSPEPSSSNSILDVFGNVAQQVSFEGSHRELTLDVNFEVEASRTNPFDYLSLDSRVTNLPAYYDLRIAQALSPNLHRQMMDRTIGHWAGEISASVDWQTQPFLSKLCEIIHREYTAETRYEGAAFSPSQTFAEKRGACRDLAALFMDACRTQGLAARFVSGYVYEPNRTHGSELHAWAEVYLPGGGWRGYDPTLGIAVADAHIPVAAGPEPEWAAPTEGCYIGEGRSEIVYEVQVTRR